MKKNDVSIMSFARNVPWACRPTMGAGDKALLMNSIIFLFVCFFRFLSFSVYRVHNVQGPVARIIASADHLFRSIETYTFLW